MVGPAATTCHHSPPIPEENSPSDNISFTCASRDLQTPKLTSMFEGQLLQNKAFFLIKTRVIWVPGIFVYTYISVPLWIKICIYVYKYVYSQNTHVDAWNENTAHFFPVVSSQCSFFQKHCWLQKINHSHEIDSPSSLSPILSIPEATCGGFSLSAMLSYLLPVFVNWRLTNGTK